MQQTFNCKEPGCDKEVVYEYDTVVTAVKHVSVQSNESEVEVYLTCEGKHTNKYTVKVSK